MLISQDRDFQQNFISSINYYVISNLLLQSHHVAVRLNNAKKKERKFLNRETSLEETAKKIYGARKNHRDVTSLSIARGFAKEKK